MTGTGYVICPPSRVADEDDLTKIGSYEFLDAVPDEFMFEFDVVTGLNEVSIYVDDIEPIMDRVRHKYGPRPKSTKRRRRLPSNTPPQSDDESDNTADEEQPPKKVKKKREEYFLSGRYENVVLNASERLSIERTR